MVINMYKRFHNSRIAAGIFLTGVIMLTGCQVNTVKMAGYSASKPLILEDGKGCPVQKLPEYLNGEPEETPYAYAQILINTTEAHEEEEQQEVMGVLGDYIRGEEDYYAINMRGTADITWQTFETAEEFQAYLLWNPEEKIFGAVRESEVSQRRRRNEEANRTSQEEPAFTEYVVQQGDTLWGISRRFYGTGRLYTQIEQDNKETLSQYRYLMPGTTLRIYSRGQ